MKAMTAKDAKNRFGELMDTVQREPVSIKKHGRPVAVVISEVEYREMKHERLRAKLAIGETQIDRGQYIQLEKEDIHDFFEQLKSDALQKK